MAVMHVARSVGTAQPVCLATGVAAKKASLFPNTWMASVCVRSVVPLAPATQP